MRAIILSFAAIIAMIAIGLSTGMAQGPLTCDTYGCPTPEPTEEETHEPDPTETETPTPTPTATATVTPTPTLTVTATVTATVVVTPRVTGPPPTATVSPTQIPGYGFKLIFPWFPFTWDGAAASKEER